MESAKGPEFMKVLLNLFKTNLNLKNYFKSFLNINCPCSKTLQLIVSLIHVLNLLSFQFNLKFYFVKSLIFNNLGSLNASQNGIARRLIERMSSLIIDKECLESLIDLVDFKVKQNLTPKQRRMLNKKKKDEKKPKPNRKGRSKKAELSEEEEKESDEEPEIESVNEESDSEAEEEDGGNEESKTDLNFLQHIDDNGEKGLKLINVKKIFKNI